MDNDTDIQPPPLRPPLHNSAAPRDNEPDVEFEKLKKWQQERMERRLRGEYESIRLHLAELIGTNIHTPLRLFSVRIEGASRTRSSFLDWLVKPHLKVAQAQNPDLESVLHTARNITHCLLATDNFSAVLPRLEASRDPLASDGDVDLIFQTRQKGRYFLKTATEIGAQEGSVSIQGRSRNTFGGAEVLEASFSSGLKTRLAGHVSLSAPLTPDLRSQGEVSVFGLEKDFTHFASCFEGVRGLKAVVRNSSRYSTSEIAYEASIRHIRNLLPTASFSIREAAGHSVKSSLSHTYIHDTRDDKAVPTRGVYLRTRQELAGLGGDASFFKSQLNCLISRKLFAGTTVSLSGRAGALFPLFGRQPLFSDCFQLGGPLDVRMFKENGLGYRDGSDSLGGDLFWAAGISVISDLPKRPQWPVKSHLFLNAGRLDTMNKDLPLSQNITACLSKPSVAVGVGLLYKLDPVRVEVNFGVPLVANRSDAQRKGIQLGIGLDFL